MLHTLWRTGRLVTWGRQAGRHVDDLPERVVPAGVLGAPPLDGDRALRTRLLRRLRAAAVVRQGADASLRSLPVDGAKRRAAFATLIAGGALEDWDVVGVRAVALPGLRDGAAAPPASIARVAAPLDHLAWDRRALRDPFGFGVVWEACNPAAQRRWGYYVVPVVVGGRFVARFDGRCEVGAGGERLRLHGWWWEEPRPDPAQDEALRLGLARFLRYLGADGVALPRGLDRATRALWTAAVAETRA